MKTTILSTVLALYEGRQGFAAHESYSNLHNMVKNLYDALAMSCWIFCFAFIQIFYISRLVRALWLVNLAGRILLYGPLKFKAVFVAKMFRDLSPSVLDIFNK